MKVDGGSPRIKGNDEEIDIIEVIMNKFNSSQKNNDKKSAKQTKKSNQSIFSS
jgi:hypothetical protein